MNRKPLILLAITLIFLIACAGATHVLPRKERKFQKVYEVDSIENQKNIYYKSLEWFVNSKSIIEVDTASKGKIVGKGVAKYKLSDFTTCLITLFKPSYSEYSHCNFTVILKAQNEGFRFTARRIIDSDSGDHIRTEQPLKNVKKAIDSVAKDLRTSINKEKKW